MALTLFLKSRTPYQNSEGEQVPCGAGKFGTGQASHQNPFYPDEDRGVDKAFLKLYNNCKV